MCRGVTEPSRKAGLITAGVFGSDDISLPLKGEIVCW